MAALLETSIICPVLIGRAAQLDVLDRLLAQAHGGRPGLPFLCGRELGAGAGVRAAGRATGAAPLLLCGRELGAGAGVRAAGRATGAAPLRPARRDRAAVTGDRVRPPAFRLKPGAADDLIRVFQDALAPASAEQPGFGGMTLLIDQQAGKALSLGLWATEADLFNGESSDQERLTNIAELLAGPPERAVYEVCVQVELTEQGTAHVRGI